MPKKERHSVDRLLEQCCDRDRASKYWSQLMELPVGRQLKSASAEQIRLLISLFSGSETLSEWVLANPDWVFGVLHLDFLQNPRQQQGLRREVEAWLKPALQSRDYVRAFRQIRQFKQREMVRIAARDLGGWGEVDVLTREISDLADVCLDSVYRLCWQQLTERLGDPLYQDEQGRWFPSLGSVFGMGKLGGQELNYSSDVDVLFVYSEEGYCFKKAPGRNGSGKGLSAHQFFNRLSEMFIAEVGKFTPEGTLYRIDLRLRPEGDSGPLSRSLASYENYYAQWGQSWERMMLIKARPVAGDKGLASEFLEMIQPFRYPRSIGDGLLKEVAGMKDRIEKEVVRTGEIDRNVKLGRGGIREVEFVAQTLQLLHAGRIPFLQGHQTLPVLEKMVQYQILGTEESQTLSAAYRYLRKLEHRLQMENNLQTHTIPVSRKSRERLACLMGHESLSQFEEVLLTHTRGVRRIFEKLLKRENQETAAFLPADFEEMSSSWKKLLSDHQFRDVDRSLKMAQEFINGPGYVHVSPRTTELARQLFPKFLELCPTPDRLSGRPEERRKILSDPDRVLARLDSFISAYGARATLYELWNRNPSIFELLLLLFDRSEFLAEVAIRTPDMVDELVLSGRLKRRKTAGMILEELRYGASDADQKAWVRNYHKTELMRIGLRDILELADYEQNLLEISALAEACLQYALEVILKKEKLKQAPVAIMGLGKLGGSELNYGSDLDIMFVAQVPAEDLPKLQRVAIGVMELLSASTENGAAFETDARLRPDGEKGLLVNTLSAYEEYYRQRAMLWEIQSLSRVRWIAGHAPTGKALEKIAKALTNFSHENVSAGFRSGPSGVGGLAAYREDWKQEIARMRGRIEKERTPGGKQVLAIKTGSGGLMDAEFIAQVFSMEKGWLEANTLKSLQRAAEEHRLSPEMARQLIENYRKLRRIEAILRRWSFEGEVVLPDDPAPQRRVAIRCGFSSADAFLESTLQVRQQIRQAFEAVFASPVA